MDDLDDIQELDAGFLGDLNLVGEPVRTDSEDEDEEIEEEIEEISDDQDEQESDAGGSDGRSAFDGPSNWEEVESSELERVMLRVTNAAMPLTDNKELLTRMALQAAALENNNNDPLGLGKIDLQTLGLIRAEEIARGQTRAGRTDFKKRGRKTSDNSLKTSDSLRETPSRRPSMEVDWNELRSKALPNSEDFEPDIFLGTIHTGTSLPDLLKGRQNLNNEVSERTGQLKALVKENFDRFISCKNTIDDIHKRLKVSEAHGGGNGTSTSDMVVVVAEIQEDANACFATLLDRATQSDQLKSVVALLKRNESIFEIPSRIQAGIKTGNYDEVIREYKRTRSLMENIPDPKPGSIWHRLFSEIEKGIAILVASLQDSMKDLTVAQGIVLDNMQYIYQLQALGSPSALQSNPMNLYTNIRVESLAQSLTEMEHAHLANLENAARQEDLAEYQQPQESEEINDMDEIMHATPGRMNTGPIWALFLQNMIAMGSKSLGLIWQAPQAKLSEGQGGERREPPAANEETSPAIMAIIKRLGDHTDQALSEMVKDQRDQQYFTGVLKDMVTAIMGFRRTEMPQAIREIAENHLPFGCNQIIDRMAIRVKRITSGISKYENFKIVASSHKAGHPASKVPGMIREVVSNSLTHLEAVIQEASVAETETYSMDPLSEHSSTLRRTFCDCFSSYAIATDQLWNSIVKSQKDTAGSASTGPSPDIKLLVLQSNCVHVRTHVLKDLTTRFGGLLTSDGDYKENKQLMGECVEDIRAVEAKLANIYIKTRIEKLNEVLDEYFEEDGTDWARAPLPSGLRDCTFEIINSLVAVQAEVYGNALSLQKRAMDEMFQHLLSAYNTCLDDKIDDLNMGGALQLLLELQYLKQAIGPSLRSPRDNLLDSTKCKLLDKIKVLARDSESNADLHGWCDTTKGKDMSYRADVDSSLKCNALYAATRLNNASFRV